MHTLEGGARHHATQEQLLLFLIAEQALSVHDLHDYYGPRTKQYGAGWDMYTICGLCVGVFLLRTWETVA